MARDGGHDGRVAESAVERTDDRSASLARDELFDLLRVERRRALLRYLDGLDDQDGSPLSELASAVAAETGDPGFESGREHRLAISLHQVHLPKLDAAGVLDYDVEARTVRLLGGNDLLFDFLYYDGEG